MQYLQVHRKDLCLPQMLKAFYSFLLFMTCLLVTLLGKEMTQKAAQDCFIFYLEGYGFRASY